MSKKLILLCLLLITNSFVYAELDEEKFGKSKGYPFAVGVPFRTIPEFRVGAYTGKGLSTYKNNNGWLQPNDAPKPLPKVFVEFKTLKPDDIVKKNHITAMMLIKDGQIVYEQYQYGSTPDTKFDSQSIAKIFTALTIGVAIDRGDIKEKDLNEKMGILVPDLKDSPLGKATLRQTLQMQCGHKFHFVDNGNEGSAGKYALKKFGSKENGGMPLPEYFKTIEPIEPGKVFAYDPHCTDALSMLMTQLTNKPLVRYFEEHIWKHLPTSSQALWISANISRDLTSAASGFYATLNDWSLISQLVVNEGEINGQKLISKSWMQRMHTDTVDVPKSESVNFRKYGYQTWVKSADKDSWFAGLGNNGQRFYIDPKTRSVMLVFGLTTDHVSDTDKLWDWFRKRSLEDLKKGI